MTAAEVVRVCVTRKTMGRTGCSALLELFGLRELPLAESHVEIEVRGVSRAVVNALRRVVTDEMPGYAFQVPPDGFDTSGTTDKFMVPDFCCHRIQLVPLRPQIPADVVDSLRLKLDVGNSSPSVKKVYSGDLVIEEGAMPEPLFNPTFEIAFLQPGKRIVIRGIRIQKGYGRDDVRYMVARRAAFRHLDIPQCDKKETDSPEGAYADLSGYKESGLVADPRHHLLTATLPATTTDPAEVRAVFADACVNIKERLRLIAAVVGKYRRSERDEHTSIRYEVVQLPGGLFEGTLQIPDETHTICVLLQRAVLDFAPNVANVSYVIKPHENGPKFSIRHTEDVTGVLLGSISQCLEVFDTVQRGIELAR